MNIQITSLSAAKRHKREFDAVLSIESPFSRPADQLRFHKSPRPDHLIQQFEDLDEGPDWVTLPAPDDARKLIAFARKHAEKRLIVHCAAGIGRSGAAGLGILADRLGPGRETDAIGALLEIRPEAVPNLALTRHLDDVLCRRGALLQAVVEENERRPNWQVIRANKAQCFRDNPSLYL